MTKPTTIALAGLGAATRDIHLPAYAKIPELTVVGGCDPEPRDDFPAPQFRDVDTMLAEVKPDVLSVVTPTDSHAELTRKGLAAGCHVLCEKPFVPTVAEADEIVRLARDADRRVVVNNEYRFMQIHAEAHARLGTPDFGRLLFLSAHQTFYTTPETEAGWRGQDKRRTCIEFGTHVLDLCRFFFGENPTRISARMPRGDRPDGPDYLNLLQLEFSGDRVAHVTLDRLCRGRHRYLDVRLDGEQGCIETSLGGRLEVSAGLDARTRRPFVRPDVALGGRSRLYHGERYETIAKDPIDLFPSATAGLVRAMLDAIERGEVPPCDASDNRHTLALMLAAYASDERGEPVELAEMAEAAALR